MTTSILNKKQQKSTLSAKKGRTKETIKNVLGVPYTSYWPEISPEDRSTLQQILVHNLPRITQKVVIPWRDLKNIPKPERKEFKEEYARNNQLKINKNDKKGVIIGVNNVTKSLEKNSVSVVLISSDVQPKLMVQHVIDQAVLYSIPVIIFNNLRSLLKEVCGVGSIVLGISKDTNPESNLNLIKESVTQIFEKCPQPVNHINYNRSVENEVVMVNDNEEYKHKPRLVENKVDEHEIRRTVYLIRDSKNRRVFTPQYTEKTPRNDIMEVDSEGFLAFSQEPVLKVAVKVKPSYKSLIVKRLKGDPNRNKRKIDKLKKKSK